uniref:Uncharacterized protein n=1 Tax=Branchiostoma floridae TaxID=7739 RepID=C3YWQ6_BRAFL|eukprot:XP_002599288.1 hypothetical protein BRAFLDRAFT_64354 [Branchiostoma floridae]
MACETLFIELRRDFSRRLLRRTGRAATQKGVTSGRTWRNVTSQRHVTPGPAPSPPSFKLQENSMRVWLTSGDDYEHDYAQPDYPQHGPAVESIPMGHMNQGYEDDYDRRSRGDRHTVNDVRVDVDRRGSYTDADYDDDDEEYWRNRYREEYGGGRGGNIADQLPSKRIGTLGRSYAHVAASMSEDQVLRKRSSMRRRKSRHQTVRAGPSAHEAVMSPTAYIADEIIADEDLMEDTEAARLRREEAIKGMASGMSAKRKVR